MPDKTVAKVRQFIEGQGLIEIGDRVLVALSGGPDSVTVFDTLKKLRKPMGFQLGAVYINHNLRPRAAAAEARFCKTLCDDHNIPFFHESVDIPALSKKEKVGIEETARRYRYDTLERLATAHRYSKIALGHHRDDSVETIIFNLVRGTGRQGIIGISPRRDRFIRPLLCLGRAEIESYLRHHQLEFMTDRSNTSSQFTRNRIRRRVIPALKREISPAAVENILRCSAILKDEEEYLNQIAIRTYRQIGTETPGGKIGLDLEKWFGYDIWLRRRLIIRALLDAGLFDIAFGDVDRLVSFADQRRSRSLQVRGSLRAAMAGENLLVFRSGLRVQRRLLPVPGKVPLEYPRQWISARLETADIEKIGKMPRRIAYFDADQIIGGLYIAAVSPGLRMHPYGRPGTKKVGDLLTDLKYPQALRDELPVVMDQRGVVWLAGIEIDDRVKIDANTRKAIRLEIGRC